MSDFLPVVPVELAAPEEEVRDEAAFRAESYGALIRRRFARSRTGVAGAILVALVLLCAIFADTLAPYDPGARDNANQNSPPQLVRLGGGGLYTHPLPADLDPPPFQPVFVADQAWRCELHFLSHGWSYGF